MLSIHLGVSMSFTLPLILLFGCTHDFGLKDYNDATGDTGAEGSNSGSYRPDDEPETTPEDTDADTAVEENGTFTGDGGTTEDTGEPENDDFTTEPDEETTEPEVDDDPPSEDDCEETSDLIYVIERDYDVIYLFDPTTESFSEVGELDCSMWGSPNSMAVARDGVAYVRYSDNVVYEVDLETMDCVETSYSGGAFGAFGMGYATDEAGSWRDRLYVANADSVGRLDTDSWSLDLLGGMDSQSELTGNSAGELWAFLPLERPAELVQLDKDSGDALHTISLSGFPNASDIDAFAFANWGGEFWLFVRVHGVGESSDVYRVGSTGVLTKVLDRVGFDIVGAGVSTCAPSE